MRPVRLLASLCMLLTALLGVVVDALEHADEYRSHVICPLDGELVHADARHDDAEAPPADGPQAKNARPDRGVTVRSDRTKHERECAFAHAGTVPAPLPAPPPPLVEPPTFSATEPSPPALSVVAVRSILSLAPKTSPPLTA